MVVQIFLKYQKMNILFEGIPKDSQVWMSHSDTITKLPENGSGLRVPTMLLMLHIEYKGKIPMLFNFIQKYTTTTDGKQYARKFFS